MDKSRFSFNSLQINAFVLLISLLIMTSCNQRASISKTTSATEKVSKIVTIQKKSRKQSKKQSPVIAQQTKSSSSTGKTSSIENEAEKDETLKEIEDVINESKSTNQIPTQKEDAKVVVVIPTDLDTTQFNDILISMEDIESEVDTSDFEIK